MIPKNRLNGGKDPWGVYDFAHTLTDTVRDIFRAGDVFEKEDMESAEAAKRRHEAYNRAFEEVRIRILWSLTAKELKVAQGYVADKIMVVNTQHLELKERADDLEPSERAAMVHAHQRLMYFRLVDAVMRKMRMNEYERWF